MVSIIIVNWNSIAYLKKCIQSIYATTQKDTFEVIVIDNASFDGSSEFINLDFPEVVFIQGKNNAGFAKANNIAFGSAQGETLLFLNPDTEIIGNAITVMSNALYSDTMIGIVGCKLLNSDMSFQTSCVQPFPTIFNQVFDAEILHNIHRGSTKYKTADFKDVEAVSGACIMIKRSVFEQVGKFSSDYFMYTEDIDLCYKVKRCGYRIYYVEQANVIHHGGKSSSGSAQSGFSVVLMHHSIYTMLSKFRGAGYAFGYRISMFLSAIIRLIILLSFAPLRIALKYCSASIINSLFKWYKIGRWSLGLESWVKRLPLSPEKPSSATG
jgi:hypothetical protein